MHKKSKLKNGINVITTSIKGTKAITILVLFPVGSRYEDKKLAGASHFVEHLMFKGTQKRPTALDISRQLEAVGAEYNAFTSKDYTGYYVKIASAKQELAYDLLSDMIFNSKLEKEEIEREKGVIIEELRMYEDNPTMAVDQLFEKTIYGDHPLGRDIGGTIESVRAMTRKQLVDYYKKYYNPANMVVVLSGDVPKGKSLKKCLSFFEQYSGKSGKNLVSNFKKYTWAKNSSIEKRAEVKKRKLDQAHVILGFPALAIQDKDKYIAAVLTNILGSGMKSRLFVEVRERRGLAYMVRAGMDSNRDVGTFQIQAGLNPARLKEAIKVIREQLELMKNELVSSKELSEAKGNLIGSMSLSSEDSSVMANLYAKQFWFSKEIKEPNEIYTKIKKVTKEEIQRVAKRIFIQEKMNIAVIGNITKKQLLSMLK